MIAISQTPVRVSFLGGGTDYYEYFSREGGCVLGTTIDKYSYITVNHLSKFFEYSIRAAYSKTELVNDINMIELISTYVDIFILKFDAESIFQNSNN